MKIETIEQLNETQKLLNEFSSDVRSTKIDLTNEAVEHLQAKYKHMLPEVNKKFYGQIASRITSEYVNTDGSLSHGAEQTITKILFDAIHNTLAKLTDEELFNCNLPSVDLVIQTTEISNEYSANAYSYLISSERDSRAASIAYAKKLANQEVSDEMVIKRETKRLIAEISAATGVNASGLPLEELSNIKSTIVALGNKNLSGVLALFKLISKAV